MCYIDRNIYFLIIIWQGKYVYYCYMIENV